MWHGRLTDMENDALLEVLQRITRVETMVTEIVENHIPHLQKQINAIKDWGKRPTYTILTLVSVLSCLCVGLIIYGVMR